MFEKIMNNIATFKQLIETLKQLRIKNLSIKMPFSLAENGGKVYKSRNLLAIGLLIVFLRLLSVDTL